MHRSSLGRLGLLFVSLLGLMSLYSASAFASGPPIVTVNKASGETLYTATASGTVNYNGAGSTYKIEYGKTKLYGKSTTVKNLYGAGAVPISEVLRGLEPLTTYHYRISATNPYGTTVSEDVLFELLLSWKVDGKPLSEAPQPPTFTTRDAVGTLALEHTYGKDLWKIGCNEKSTKYYSNGYLEQKYQLLLTDCKTYLNGKEVKACAPPSDLTWDFDAYLVSTKSIVLYLGEECAIGENISLPAGLSVGATPSQKEPLITLTAINDIGWTVTYSAAWKPTGAINNLTLGIL